MINPEFLKRVMTIAMKNGDRVVVTDPATDKAVVVMDFESYEKFTVASVPPSPAQTVKNKAAVTPVAHPAPLSTSSEPTTAPVKPTPPPKIEPTLEQEEKFYLEPIE